MRCDEPGIVSSDVKLPDGPYLGIASVRCLNTTIHVVAQAVGGLYNSSNFVGSAMNAQRLRKLTPPVQVKSESREEASLDLAAWTGCGK